MNKKIMEDYFLQLPGAESSFPFGPEARVFKVMGKMFALVSQLEDSTRVTLKCRPADGEVLTGHYKSVIPGYHMNKKHWITISLDGELGQSMTVDLAKNSYDLVVSKLTKADQKKLLFRQ